MKNPISNDIPEEYRELLTKEVLEQFAANLLTFFPAADDLYTYRRVESTVGWVDAFEKAVRVQKPYDKYRKLLGYYFGLEGYDFDTFNDKVLDLMIEFGILSFNPGGKNEAP